VHWILDFIFSHKNGTSLFVTILLSLLMINSPLSQQQKIAQILGGTLFFPVQYTVNQVTKIRNVFGENDKLRTRLQDIELENASLKETLSRGDEFQRNFSYRDTSSFKLIAAQAVVREPTFLYRTIVIDAGAEEGVEPYMPVVSVDGVVGKVIRVLDRSSLVQLIRKPDEYVSVTHRLSGAVGILSTGTKNELQVEFRKHRNVAIGDTLFTSGFGGIYPTGLPVAEVVSIEEAQNPLYNHVTVRPTVNFDGLRHLFVLAVDTRWQAYQLELDSLMREVE
jgi:rod shape-determining protein MreC